MSRITEIAKSLEDGEFTDSDPMWDLLMEIDWLRRALKETAEVLQESHPALAAGIFERLKGGTNG